MECNVNDNPAPVIDLAHLCSSKFFEENDILRIGKAIVDAFKDPGFVYLKNIGITTEELNDYVTAGNKFFNLDEDTKNIHYRPTDTLHGYSDNLAESLDYDSPLAKTKTRFMFDIQGLDEPLRFPEQVPELKTSAKTILDKLMPVTEILLKAIEAGLDFSSGFIVDKHKHVLGTGSLSGIRVLSYLPSSVADLPLRIENHKDFDTVTLQLYEDVDGLQVLDAKGNWKSANIQPGNALLFPGEILEFLTGGMIKALEHRVANPADKNDYCKPRHSVIFFLGADNDAIIHPYGNSDDFPLLTVGKFVIKKTSEIFKPGPVVKIDGQDILLNDEN